MYVSCDFRMLQVSRSPGCGWGCGVCQASSDGVADWKSTLFGTTDEMTGNNTLPRSESELFSARLHIISTLNTPEYLDT